MPYEARPIYDQDVIQVTSNKLFRMQVYLREAGREEEPREIRESTAVTAVLSNIQESLGIQYDPVNSLFFVDRKPIPAGHLNEQEIDLLHLFYENEDEVCTFIDIEEKVWGILPQGS
jgi:DNA-binding response OmpR family regulator